MVERIPTDSETAGSSGWLINLAVVRVVRMACQRLMVLTRVEKTVLMISTEIERAGLMAAMKYWASCWDVRFQYRISKTLSLSWLILHL